MRFNPRGAAALLAASALLALAVPAAPVHAQIYVKADAAGSNDGSSWTNAFNDLQDALIAAWAGDEIWVAAGEYEPDTISVFFSFVVPAGVALYGGFNGTEEARTERDWAMNVTVLDGEINSPDSTDNSQHVVTCLGGNSDTVLDGFTVRRGVGNPTTLIAGGMRIENSSVTVANVIFEGNSSRQKGGAVYLDGGSPNFINVEFTRNTAGFQMDGTTYAGHGGGVFVQNGSPTFNGCTFRGNAAIYGYPRGGGVGNFGVGKATFTNCMFDGNTPSGISNGEVEADSCTFINNTGTGIGIESGTVTNCIAEYNGSGFIAIGSVTFEGCTAAHNSGSGFSVASSTIDHCVSKYNGGAYKGAGMQVRGSTTVTDCAIIGNTATQLGGGVHVAGDSSSFVNCLILDNNTQFGGGICVDPDGVTSLTNCFFIGNSAGYGGGWHSMEGCGGRMTNVTFYGNTAASAGDAISVRHGCPEIYNTVAWGNGSDPVSLDYGGTATFSSSLIEGSGGSGAWNPAFGTDGGGNIDVDPLFIDAPGGNVRLSLDSPAIDAGDNGAPNVTATDYDGNPRIVGATIDMGAFEFACPVGPRIFVDAEATGTENGASWTDAFTTLQHALAVACDNVTEIWVADGTYTPTGGDNREASFQMRNGVTVYGGFTGGETAVAERDIGANAAVLSGEVGSSSPMDNAYHVVTGSGTDATAVLDGFTITGGYASGSYPDDRGGGLLNLFGDPAVRNVVVVGNKGLTGGGLANVVAHPEVTNAVFVGNEALTGTGGAIHNTGSSPTLTNITVYGNDAARDGGGLYNFAGDPVIANVILWGNENGDIVNVNTSPVISHSLIQGSGGSANWDPATGTDGGGNIDADPMFVDPGVGNLRLGVGSPAIDAGDNGAPNLLAMDLDGNMRIIGAAVDMGAYEANHATAIGEQAPRVRITALTSLHPNPFNPNLTIEFTLEHPGEIEISTRSPAL